MRIIVAGDRNWVCDELAASILRRLVDRYGPDLVIVHGGGTGVDLSIGRAAKSLNVSVEPYAGDQPGMSSPAKPIRNLVMVRGGASLCVVLHRNLALSRATKDLAQQAIRAGIPTYLVDSDEGLPTRLTERDRRLR
jgi:hypothetical protein